MSNAVQKVEPTEVVTAKQSAEILAKCEARITTLNDQLQRGEKLGKGLRFLMGMQMIVAKPHVPHGNSSGDGFEAWCKNKFQIEERVAQEHIRFASTLLAVAPKQLAKSEHGSLFKQLPEHISNGGLTEKEQDAIVEMVPQVVGDRSIREFIKEHAVKPERKIKFHCPECGHENEGIVGRQITCAHTDCKEKITVAEDAPTAEQQIKERIKRTTDLITAHTAQSLQFLAKRKKGDELTDIRDVDRATLEAARDASLEWTKALKQALKKRAGSRGAKKEVK